MELKQKLREYWRKIKEEHKSSENISGFEKNDRNIFIKYFLSSLGYELKNLLDDVSQKSESGSKIPDIRIYGNNEYKSKHTHSQFIIETKNFKYLNRNIDKIDFLQLKRYIIANKSKIRVICTTDYLTIFAFNATKLKKDNQINFNDFNNISDWKINIIKASLLFMINFDNLNDEDLKNIISLSHNAIFNKYVFYDPDNFLYTGDISDSSVRKGFITSLYEMMMKIKSDVQPDFNSKIRRMQNFIEEHRDMKEYLIMILLF